MKEHSLPLQMVVSDIDGVLKSGLEALATHGIETGSRAGGTTEVVGARFVITDPVQRGIRNPHRKHSDIAQLAETLWVLAGSNDITWMSKFLPRAPDFSDDGITWRAAYGDRLRHWPISMQQYQEALSNNNFEGVNQDKDGCYVDQLLAVVSELRKTIGTRQAVMTIWDPARELTAVGATKDMPCNDLIQFLVRDNKLHMHVYVRSNDLIWGLTGINYFEFSVLQELVASWIGVEVGNYIHSAMSLHMYSRHYEAASKMLSWYQGERPEPSDLGLYYQHYPISSGNMDSDLSVISVLFKLIGEAASKDPESLNNLNSYHNIAKNGDSSQLITFFNPLIHHVLYSTK